MITPDIVIDVDAATRFLTDVEKRQVPFAASRALNNLAKRAQATVRQELDPRFTIAPSRRKFLERLVRIGRGDWATKSNLAVRIGVSQREGGAGGKDRSHVLGRHEAGGERHAANPLKPFYIPSDELRKGVRDLPPRNLYPTALRLMESRGVVGQTIDAKSKKRKVYGNLPAQSRTTSRGKVQIEGKRRTFVMGSHDGRMRQTWGVWQRTGPGKDDIRPLWWYRPRITLKPRLKFSVTIQRVVDRDWAREFSKTLDDALSTAR